MHLAIDRISSRNSFFKRSLVLERTCHFNHGRRPGKWELVILLASGGMQKREIQGSVVGAQALLADLVFLQSEDWHRILNCAPQEVPKPTSHCRGLILKRNLSRRFTIRNEAAEEV